MKPTTFSKLILIGLALIYLIVFKDFPYFNLILETKIIAGMVLLLAIFLFPVEARLLVTGGLLMLVVAGGLILIGKENWAQPLGDIIYILMIVSVIKQISHERKSF